MAGNPYSLVAEDLYFPGSSWETVTPEAARYDAKKLDETLEFAMSCHSSSVVILWNGRILAQRHTQLSDGSQVYQRTVAGQSSEEHVCR